MDSLKKDWTNIASISQNMGERLTMFYLCHYLNWDVEYVDYVGADLIAVGSPTSDDKDEKNRRKYAISVKTRKMSETWKGDKVDTESCSVTSFRDSDAKFLRGFANDMGMEALVAYVVVFQQKKKKRGNNSAFLFLIGLDDLEDMRDDNRIKFVVPHTAENKKGFSLRFMESVLNELCGDSRVTWFKMEIDDHKIAEGYNLNHKSTNDHLKSEHWKKQQGTFGEYLALWSLGKNHEMRGFRVDSIGADIVLLDSKNPDDKNEQYAVSVKTFTYDKTCSYQFEKRNEDKLIRFSKKWTLRNDKSIEMKPMICFNCVRYNGDQMSKIYMMAFAISHVDEIPDEKYIHRTAGGITICYDNDSLNAIKKDEKVIFSEIDFTNYHYHILNNC